MIDAHGIYLLAAAAAAVLALILLVAWAKLNPFLSILLVSLSLGVAGGMPLSTILRSFETGLGNTLAHIAVVVALGTMLGKVMAESGGATAIANRIIDWFGEKRVPWAMMAIGFLVGLPVFFEVGFVLLIPIAFTVARRTKTNLVLVALPMLAGLSVVHGLIPPHPAALLAASIYKANVGRTIFYGVLIGLPTAILAGPIWAKIIAPFISLPAENPMSLEFAEHNAEQGTPSFTITVATILLPVALMMLGSWADSISPSGSFINQALHLVGNDDIALFLGVLLSFYTFGKMRGISRDTILRFTNECLAPTATVTLLVGAGGGFGRILQDSGVSGAIVTIATASHVPLILFAWLLAALMRLATGSATVAMTTAAGIVAPIALHTPGAHPELLAIATGAGSLIFSHVNDGGFWLVKEYLGLSVPQTIKTWSICETIISVNALVFALTLSLLPL
jgi:GntP family gluconate:H+ symporter